MNTEERVTFGVGFTVYAIIAMSIMADYGIFDHITLGGLLIALFFILLPALPIYIWIKKGMKGDLFDLDKKD